MFEHLTPVVRYPPFARHTLDSPGRPGSVGSVAIVVVGLLVLALLTTGAPSHAGTFSGRHEGGEGGAMQMSMQMTFTVRLLRPTRCSQCTGACCL